MRGVIGFIVESPFPSDRLSVSGGVNGCNMASAVRDSVLTSTLCSVVRNGTIMMDLVLPIPRPCPLVIVDDVVSVGLVLLHVNPRSL